MGLYVFPSALHPPFTSPLPFQLFRAPTNNTCRTTVLSRTPSLTGSHKSGKGGGGPYLVTLSYWKSIDHLRTFAAQSSHAEVRRWWERTRQQWPHIGIFHETYDVPPCHYETIYENFHPFGMGAIGLGKEKGQALRKAEGKGWKTMDDRMGRGE